MNYRTLFIGLLLSCGAANAQSTTRAVVDADPATAIGSLRSELIESFNAGDVNRLLSHLDPDVVVTWQNGEVCRGPEQVKAYYDKMMSGPDRIVKTVHADPKVTNRHVYGDWAVSWGMMNDEFVLNDGSQFRLDSRFTATIARRGDVWKVSSFHVSANIFDNQIMGYAMKRAALWTGVVAGAIGLAIGFVAARVLRRKGAP